MLRNKYYIVKTIIVFILLIAVSSQVFSQEKKPVKAPVKGNSASSKNTTGETKPVVKKTQVTKNDSTVKDNIASDSLKTVKAIKKKSIADSVKKTVKKLPVADTLVKSKSSVAKKPGVKPTSSPVKKTLKDSTKALNAETDQKKSLADSLLKSKAKAGSTTTKPATTKGAKAIASPVKKTPKDSITKALTAAKADSVNAIPVGFAVDKPTTEQKATTKKGAPAKGSGKTDPKGKGAKNAKTPPVKKPIMNIISANSVGSLNLGADIDTIKKLFPKERVYRVYVYDQNNRYVQYQIVASDKITPFLNITQDCVTDSVCLIKQILVKSPYFKTDRGIVVGNSLDDLFLAYGYLESRWEEENLIVRIGDGIDFIMDTSQIPKRWYKKMNLDRLPLPTKIVGIQISIFE